MEDIQAAADVLRPVYDATGGGDGYVSLEVSPYLANDTKGTVTEAKRLWKDVGRKNLMVKVPATAPGLPAIRQLTGEGINVNITLLFSQKVYEQVVAAYLGGLEDLIARGEDPIAFDYDCREGICGSCGVMINGIPHGPVPSTATCQLFLRHFKDGDTITLEPWRARAFPVIKDLVVDRSALDRIVAAGGYVSVDAGSAPERRTSARSEASFCVKLPVICPSLVMRDFTLGADCT